MNKHVKVFLHRGFLFGGFGPVVMGIAYAVLEKTVLHFSLGGREVLAAILSTYLLAFVQAGASVFNQIESFSLPKALLCHLSLLYVAYIGCYLVNDWIPFEPVVLLIFTIVFLVIYFAVWLTVFLIVRSVGRRMSKKLQE
ncbi:MAG: DUF3021 domain-containing protein [Ruminococcaceae bacterium]|nr:DUF3021 domain-containing protein [Oscillospiraceae bacterium]